MQVIFLQMTSTTSKEWHVNWASRPKLKSKMSYKREEMRSTRRRASSSSRLNSRRTSGMPGKHAISSSQQNQRLETNVQVNHSTIQNQITAAQSEEKEAKSWHRMQEGDRETWASPTQAPLAPPTMMGASIQSWPMKIEGALQNRVKINFTPKENVILSQQQELQLTMRLMGLCTVVSLQTTLKTRKLCAESRNSAISWHS